MAIQPTFYISFPSNQILFLQTQQILALKKFYVLFLTRTVILIDYGERKGVSNTGVIPEISGRVGQQHWFCISRR